MKKLDALIAGFADEVFRAIRGATLGELAELLGTAVKPDTREPSVAKLAAPGRGSKTWTSGGGLPSRRTRHVEHVEHVEPDELYEPPNAQAMVAEITDPESLLRLESDVPSPRSHPEPSPEPPPASTEKPIPSSPVLLRANEALVRASSAGIVIRRRKGA